MLFNSFEFLLFLPVMLVLYYISSKRIRQIFLLIGSYFFYCYAYPIYGILLIFSTVLDYIVGWLLENEKRKSFRRLYLSFSLIGNLGLLAFFKYADFLGSSFFASLQFLGFHQNWKMLGFILPIGISFYTFQTMSYTIEIYWGKFKPTHDFISFALYVSFFPQLVAGPIERAPNLLPQLQKMPSVTFSEFIEGTRRIFWGLIKKMVIADRLAFLVDHVYNSSPDNFSSATIWLATYAFAFQIYFDFSGYSDIAIGTAKLFGIELMENFNLPYLSTNISEFWRRWHISFSTWLRDYLYIPIGGSKHGVIRTLLNVTIVMFLGGLWHGAAWTFVIWGLYQGFLLVIYHSWKQFRKRKNNGKQSSTLYHNLITAISIVFTFHLACVGWVFFRASNLKLAITLLDKMFFGWHSLVIHKIEHTSSLPFVIFIIILYIFQIIQELTFKNKHFQFYINKPILNAIIILFLAVFLMLFAVSNSIQFIYFQF